MRIDGIEGLEFEDRDFRWRGRSVAYSDIEGVSFTATVTRHSVNGIPTGKSYAAELRLHLDGSTIEIEPEKGWFGKLKEEGMIALQRASEVFSELSFTGRVEIYERQVAERGFFNFNGVQFHKDGHLFRDGREVGSVRDESTGFFLEPFTLILTKKKKSLGDRLRSALSNSDIRIDLTRDRDCLLYMLKKLYGVAWKNSPVREKRVDRQRLFYETVVRFGAMLAMIDGNADPSELSQLKRFFCLDTEKLPSAARIFNEEISRRSTLSEVLGGFAKEFKEAEELKESFLLGMLSVALADRVFDQREFDLIRRAAAFLGLDEGGFLRILAAAGIHRTADDSGAAGKESHADRPGFAKGRSAHLGVLGLSDTANSEEIGRAYRALVRRYHPDVLRGQGLPEDEISKASAILVQINLAYEALSATA